MKNGSIHKQLGARDDFELGGRTIEQENMDSTAPLVYFLPTYISQRPLLQKQF